MKRKNLLFLGCLLLVSVFSFGLQLSKLGFYLDDWVILTAYNQDGVNGLINYSIGDSRPFVAWVWIVGSYLFGSQPLGWQIYSLAFRILTAFIGWLILNKFLTKHTLQAGIISLLFFIYPIFKQQSTSLAFSFHWVGYSLFLLSIYLQILGTEKKPNLNIWLILGTLFNGIQLFTQEYFIALELSRPFIIGLFLWKNSQAKKFSWNKWIFVNLPYLLLFFGYLGWRFIFVSLPVEDRNAPKLLEAFFSTPVYAIRRWVELFFQSMIEALLGSWYHALDPKSIVLKPVSAALSWGIVFICTTLSFLLLKMFAERSDKGIATNYQNWYKVAFPVGVILMVLGFIPGWGIGRTIADTSGLYNDRFGLPAMFGSSIVVVSGIEWFIENRKAKAFLFSILISIAIGYQYRIQTEYVNSWLQQKNFHDQLLTRAPEIQPNTAIISNQVIAKFVGSWADTSAINQMYDPTKKYDTNILWYYTIGDINLDFLQKNYYSLTERNKFLIFNGNLNDSIVITNPSSTQCLWVLDESDRNNPYIDSKMQKMLPFSKKERIIPSETTKDQVSIFGENPEKNWCYYFQKASLARQSENWQEIIRLYNQTQEDRLSPRNAAEFIPFIEAFIAEKRWDEAVTLTEIARKPIESPYYPLENYLCKTWERFGSKVNQKESQNQISNEMKKLGCQTQAE